LSKKNLDYSAKEERQLIEPAFGDISISRQCELLGLSRSGYYFQPVPVNEEDLLCMNLIDEEYQRVLLLWSSADDRVVSPVGHEMNHKRVNQFMNV